MEEFCSGAACAYVAYEYLKNLARQKDNASLFVVFNAARSRVQFLEMRNGNKNLKRSIVAKPFYV